MNNDNNIKSFNFSFDMVSKTKNEIDHEATALRERIEKIVDHFSVNDVPILKFILNVTESRNDLKKLSKALDRLADLTEHHNSLVKKLNVIEQAEADPTWFALAFGDFKQEVEDGIEKFFNVEN
jgi:archaellum component FlaC